MEAPRIAVVVAFAIVIAVFFFIIVTRIINPFAESGPFGVGDTVAIYIDTLSSVDDGSVSIPLTPGTVESVEVSYEEKGKRDDYEISEDGWYVILTYKISGKTSKSASRINTLPAEGGFEKEITRPDAICVKKTHDMLYAEVDQC